MNVRNWFNSYKEFSFEFDISWISMFILMKMYIMFTISMLVILKLYGIEITTDVLKLYEILLMISVVELILVFINPVWVLIHNLIVWIKNKWSRRVLI